MSEQQNRATVRERIDAFKAPRSTCGGAGIMQVGVILLSSLLFACAPAQRPPSDERIWGDFIQWYRNNPQWDPQDPYRDKLRKDGVPEAEATRRAALVGKLATEREEALSIFFNFVFTREKPSFRTDPNALLVETVKDLKPGRALDVAMGQGRNAIWLAEQGWDVTGFDISAEGIAAARIAAERKRVKITALQSSWQKFDFGQAQWDLIVLSYAFVPIWDPAFYARLRDSLKREGVVVFEHFLHDGPDAVARFAGTPEPNELLRVFVADFRILRYEDTLAVSEWFPREAPLVRMVARRR